MRKALLVAIALGMSAVLITPMVNAADPPGKTTIDCNKKSKKVEFDHAAHMKRSENPPAGEKEKGCKICHHKEEGKSCCECHKEKADGGTPKFQDAFHTKCREGCHKLQGKGPTKKCEECHGK